jgi:hypothetical protein
MSTNYTYDLKIGLGADLLTSGAFSEALPNCGEIVVTSKNFGDYETCERHLTGLLTTLTQAENSIGGKNHVVVTKLNPILDPSGKMPIKGEEWDHYTVMRAYVADADELKKTNLKFSMMAQIRVDQVILGLRSTQQKIAQ